MAPVMVRQAKLKKRVVNGSCPHPNQEKVPKDPCPSSIHPKICQCITFTYDLGDFSHCCHCARTQEEGNLDLLQPTGAPRISPAGFQSQMLWGVPLPDSDPPAQGLDPSLFRDNLCSCDNPPTSELTLRTTGTERGKSEILMTWMRHCA